MGAASFCGGVRHKRYSGQQETAPEKLHYKLFQIFFLIFDKNSWETPR